MSILVLANRMRYNRFIAVMKTAQPQLQANGQNGMIWKVKSLTSLVQTNPYRSGMLRAFEEGSVSLPALLIRYYHALDLNETDMMLIIHLWTFREKEQIAFPTIEQICSRMSAGAELVIASIQKLLKAGCLAIDEKQDPVTSMKYEEYNLSPLLMKLADYISGQEAASCEEKAASSSAAKEESIFTAFENEFGRPLSPMECETISSWIDEDNYSEELIRAALKESVFAGKVHFRYIDRILLEWSRNRVRTAEEAKAYSQRFRG